MKSYKGSSRQKVWMHNSYLGHVGMMKAQTKAIANSPTTTPEAKDIAKQIHNLALKLGEELKKRV